MLGELVPCGGGDPVPLLKEKIVVGRRSSCDVCLRFPNVSSHHCELEFKNGYWHVQDLNSSNGIKVNGNRCDSQWLTPGDVLSISKHQYEIDYTPTSDGPPPDDEDIMAVGLLEKAGIVSSDRRPDRRPDGSPDGDSRSERKREAEPPKPRANRVTQPIDEDDEALNWLADVE